MLVGARGFEPRTPCAQGLVARRFNNLDRLLRVVIKCYRCLVQQGFPAINERSVTLGKVWWWAQNWAQYGPPLSEISPLEERFQRRARVRRK
jgi:hypothetical protein